MSVTIQECQAALDSFYKHFRPIMNEEGIHGVQVAWRENNIVLEVLVQNESQQRNVLSILENQHFAYSFEGKSRQINIQVVARPIARPQGRPGDPANGDGLRGFGTLGWNLILNGQVTCLSNWHVFCTMGNDTPLGWNLDVNGRREATLSAFQTLSTAGNTWDYALGQYINPSDASDQMRPCDDGSETSFPQSLSPSNSVVVGDGATYHKVGAAPTSPTCSSSICRTGQLVAVGNRNVGPYDDGVTRNFVNQLIFSKMTCPGDSGAIIVRESDWTVTALNFAGNDTETIANPLYMVPWASNGLVSIMPYGRSLLPSFTGPEVPDHRLGVEAAGSGFFYGLTGQESLGKNKPTYRHIRSSNSEFGNSTRMPFDLPGLHYGKSVLGSITGSQQPPSGTTDVIDLHNGGSLCVGNPQTDGFSIVGDYKTPPPTTPINTCPLGFTRDILKRDAPYLQGTYLELGARNDPNAKWFLGIAVATATRLSRPDQFGDLFDTFIYNWITSPPPPRPGTTNVYTAEIFNDIHDQPASLAEPRIIRTVTTYYVCWG